MHIIVSKINKIRKTLYDGVMFIFQSPVKILKKKREIFFKIEKLRKYRIFSKVQPLDKKIDYGQFTCKFLFDVKIPCGVSHFLSISLTELSKTNNKFYVRVGKTFSSCKRDVSPRLRGLNVSQYSQFSLCL